MVYKIALVSITSDSDNQLWRALLLQNEDTRRYDQGSVEAFTLPATDAKHTAVISSIKVEQNFSETAGFAKRTYQSPSAHSNQRKQSLMGEAHATLESNSSGRVF